MTHPNFLVSSQNNLQTCRCDNTAWDFAHCIYIKGWRCLLRQQVLLLVLRSITGKKWSITGKMWSTTGSEKLRLKNILYYNK